MNSKRIVGITLAVVVAAGLGVLANVATNGASAADKDAEDRPTTSAPVSPADLVLAPGVAGPVTVGMDKQQALDTGLFVADVPGSVDGCPALPLVWKAPFAPALDVQADAEGDVVSVGVREGGPVTADGLGVGSSYADVRARYDGARAVAAGYGQSGVLVRDGDNWIGFLFDAAPAAIADTDEVTFVELTEGEAPSLMRDGC